MEKNPAYAYWLANIRGIGARRLLRLRETYLALRVGASGERYGGAVYHEKIDFAQAVYQMEAETLFNLCMDAWGEGERTRAALERLAEARGKNIGEAEAALRALAGRGIAFYSVEAEDYPDKLRWIPDPPYALYVRGRLPNGAKPSAAIIGARMASPYGREQARRFAGALAENGIQIVSGMARGIDGIAGEAALAAGGASFAVLGSGVDVCYPEENRTLYEKLAERGGVISEYPPGTEAQARLFPARNRIISALAEVLLVIEAKTRSGTLITVDMALEQGREVYALPGRVSDALSVGCNRLIKQGAAIATDPEEILSFFYGVKDETERADKSRLQWQTPPSAAPRYLKEETLALPPNEQAIYRALSREEAAGIDALAAAAQRFLGQELDAAAAMRAVMMLVVRGLAVEEGTGQYRRA